MQSTQDLDLLERSRSTCAVFSQLLSSESPENAFEHLARLRFAPELFESLLYPMLACEQLKGMLKAVPSELKLVSLEMLSHPALLSCVALSKAYSCKWLDLPQEALRKVSNATLVSLLLAVENQGSDSTVLELFHRLLRLFYILSQQLESFRESFQTILYYFEPGFLPRILDSRDPHLFAFTVRSLCILCFVEPPAWTQVILENLRINWEEEELDDRPVSPCFAHVDLEAERKEILQSLEAFQKDYVEPMKPLTCFSCGLLNADTHELPRTWYVNPKVDSELTFKQPSLQDRFLLLASLLQKGSLSSSGSLLCLLSC
jgi:hypothetical protein